MKIRAVRSSDLPNVASLLQTSFDTALRPYMTYAQHGIESYLAVHVDKPELFGDRTCLVCTDGGDLVVGYAEFVEPEDGTYFLSYICVASDMRRRGVASALIEHFVRSRRSVGRLELEVLRHNTSAINTYLRLGFAQVDGERTWLKRPLPMPATCSSTRLEMSALAVYEPMHASYGFSELPVRWSGRDVRLGRIGAGVLRCFDADAFLDEALLSAVRRVFPNLTEAFLILDGAHEPISFDNATVVAQTMRMARVLGPSAATEEVTR